MKLEEERTHEKAERYLRAVLILKSEKNKALQREPCLCLQLLLRFFLPSFPSLSGLAWPPHSPCKLCLNDKCVFAILFLFSLHLGFEGRNSRQFSLCIPDFSGTHFMASNAEIYLSLPSECLD